jgi:murein DD-endopeptidase MepM/ murein hydrolase activator NlpD
MRNQFRCSVALLGACMMLAVPVVASADISQKIHSEQQHMHETREQLEARRSDLHAAQMREVYLRDQLAETGRSISEVDGRLSDLGGQIQVEQRKIDLNQVQLAQAKATLQRHTDALRHRLVDVYENGDLGYLQVLLSAHSFSEFVERWDDIKFLIAANQRTIRERREAEQQVAQVQSELESDAAALTDEQEKEQRQKEVLDSLDQQRRNLVAVADQVRKDRSAAVVELEESSQAQESELQALIVEKQKEEEAALEAQREAARRAAALAGAPAPITPGAPGDFSWPVSGPITSPFGMRLDPVSGEFTRMHTGIDIGAPFGATIGAAASGRVILAGWTDGGYGNMIVVDHGGGISSLYAHCSQVFVSAGQDVQRGQALGAVGSTGHSTGPHLHFEIRVGGQPVDPTSRLR